MGAYLSYYLLFESTRVDEIIIALSNAVDSQDKKRLQSCLPWRFEKDIVGNRIESGETVSIGCGLSGLARKDWEQDNLYRLTLKVPSTPEFRNIFVKSGHGLEHRKAKDGGLTIGSIDASIFIDDKFGYIELGSPASSINQLFLSDELKEFMLTHFQKACTYILLETAEMDMCLLYPETKSMPCHFISVADCVSVNNDEVYAPSQLVEAVSFMLETK